MTDEARDARDAPDQRSEPDDSREERTTSPFPQDAQASSTEDVDPEVLDLQLLVEQIAASAGDPPEHGLAGVAARRRRRKRHRRGAVATAMTLAVVAALTMPFALRGDEHDVTAADSASGGPRRAEMPDTVQLTCAASGIDVPVASIRPQPDGLHVEVFNDLPGPTRVWVRAVAEDDPEQPVWDSGPLHVDRGRHEIVQPVPPGVLTVGCRIGEVEQQRQVELVDVDGSYETPELSCDEDDHVALNDVAVPENASGEPSRSYVVATRAALRPLTTWDETEVSVTEPRGYPDQRFGSWTYQPMTAVAEGEEVLALVSLTGADGEAPAEAPWTRAAHVDVCKSFLNDEGLLALGA
jgi:hypothetical protein